MSSQKCPFKVGDTVVYTPSGKGRGLVAMTDPAALKPGNKYNIVRIDKGAYVVVAGFENAAGGGLYWTEFSPASFQCPVCGYPNLTEEPRHADGGGSDEICPSCGFQFGYHDDDRGITFSEWRRDWIGRGMPWSSEGISSPVGWDPIIQLQDVQGINPQV